ncbi:MAG: DMT family transporter, partial [Pseudomonadota bacterium]
AMVQATMIGWALVRGDRPIPLEWLGLLIAFGAFIWLVSPGLQAPDPLGAALMALSGIAWGAYSVRGRSAIDPLAATAGNFMLSTPFGLVVSLIFIGTTSAGWYGVGLAVASGAITPGLGYALWYRVLRQITATQGAIVQLTVPVIAAAGGVVFAAEPITARFLIASALILGGVAIAIIAKTQRA